MNLWDILIAAIIAVILFFAIRHIVKNRGNNCSCGCGGCAMRDTCSAKKEE